MPDPSPASSPVGKHGSPKDSKDSSQENTLPPSIIEELSAIGGWLTKNPLATAVLLSISATLVYFFWFFSPFVNHMHSTIAWAMTAWNPEGNQEHGRLVPFIALGLIWYHKDELWRLHGKGSMWGLLWLGVGCLLYVAGVRCLQPRLCLSAIPFLLYGGVVLTSGNATARVIIFPCLFLFFMIPVAALEQATFRLQFVITGLVGFLSHFIGIGIDANGTTLTASDGSFNFEIAEGCSGIRSLTAMTMLTAAYVHLTQNRAWKQGVIFFGSVLFAIIGNVGRIFTIILVAKYYDPKFAGGLYHDYSGYVFFPIAVIAMLGFAKLVNLKSNKTPNASKTTEANA